MPRPNDSPAVSEKRRSFLSRSRFLSRLRTHSALPTPPLTLCTPCVFPGPSLRRALPHLPHRSLSQKSLAALAAQVPLSEEPCRTCRTGPSHRRAWARVGSPRRRPPSGTTPWRGRGASSWPRSWRRPGPHMVHCHAVHLALAALLSPCTMCGAGGDAPRPQPPQGEQGGLGVERSAGGAGVNTPPPHPPLPSTGGRHPHLPALSFTALTSLAHRAC